jgi:hypothetical protein
MLGFGTIFTNNVGDFYFRAAQRQENRGGQTKDENHRYRDHDGEPSKC